MKLVIHVDGTRQVFETDAAVVTLGRAPENTIQVTDPKSSRNHCRIERTEQGWKVVDLESSNGTSVNGELVNARILKRGDRVTIGAFAVEYDPLPAPAAGGEPAIVTAPKSRQVSGSGSHAKIPHVAPQHQRAAVAGARRDQADAASFVKVAVLAALLLVGGVVGVNHFFGNSKAGEQRAALVNAQDMASKGDLDLAAKAIENLMAGSIDSSVHKDAKKALDDIRGRIAQREDAARKQREAQLASDANRARVQEFEKAYEETLAFADASLALEKFGEALSIWKQFQQDNPDSPVAAKVDERIKEVHRHAQDAWDAVQERANRMTKLEEYAQAAAFLSSSVEKFSGTRFYYEAQDKLVAVNRLAGVNAAYAGGSARLSARTQDTLLTISDLVKARRYAEALRSFDSMIAAVPADERGALDSQRADIAAQAALFTRLIDAVNGGHFVKAPVQLGNGDIAILEHATEDQLDIALRDEEGKGGTASRKWHAIDAATMVGYFEALELSSDEKFALAIFCYANGLAENGASLLNEIVKRDSSREGAVFAMVARMRGIPVPPGGFVFYSGGWYSNMELQYAKLEVDGKRGASMIASTDAKKAQQGWEIWKQISSDPSATNDIKARVQQSYVTALKNRRVAIVRALSNSGSLVNASVMRDLKKELIRRRADAIKVVYDKEIYPDADHGKVGQPKVDEAVGKVRELWENPLQVVGKLSTGISDLIASSEQTDAWLTQLNAAPSAEDQASIQSMLARVNEALSLKNYCLDGGERSALEKYKAVMAYNDRHPGFDSSEKDCIRATNEYRFMMGRPALEAHDLLGKAARGHSTDMATRNFFAHESPVAGKKSPGDRCRVAGYPGGGVGENIAMGMSGGREACLAWYNSSGHHRNMLSDMYNQIGIGKSGTYWTENLGRGGSSMGKETAAKNGGKTTAGKRSGGDATAGGGDVTGAPSKAGSGRRGGVTAGPVAGGTTGGGGS